jgi:hypothetical protein
LADACMSYFVDPVTVIFVTARLGTVVEPPICVS